MSSSPVRSIGFDWECGGGGGGGRGTGWLVVGGCTVSDIGGTVVGDRKSAVNVFADVVVVVEKKGTSVVSGGLAI